MEALIVIIAMLLVGGGCFIVFKISQSNQEFLIKMINYALLIGLAIALSVVSVGLGYRTESRGRTMYNSNLNDVQEIWGGEIVQNPPEILYQAKGKKIKENSKTGKEYTVDVIVKKEIKLKESDINIEIKKDIRKKGLQLYNGYVADFKAKYILFNPLKVKKKIFFNFPLPKGGNNIREAVLKIDGKEYKEDQQVYDGLNWAGVVPARKSVVVEVSYKCQGLNRYKYALDSVTREIPKFRLKMVTDYKENSINYFGNSMVHSGVLEKGDKSEILWESENLISRQPIAVSFTSGKRIDEIVTRLYLHAPIAIILFLGILLVFSIAYNLKLHFMHFLFFGAGFVMFYFLLSYIVTYIGFIPGFIVSAILSSSMLIYYATILKRTKKLVQASVMGLVMFQGFFSLAFYYPMHTGFLILLGSLVTLVVIMRATAGIEWKGKF